MGITCTMCNYFDDNQTREMRRRKKKTGCSTHTFASFKHTLLVKRWFVCMSFWWLCVCAQEGKWILNQLDKLSILLNELMLVSEVWALLQMGQAFQCRCALCTTFSVWKTHIFTKIKFSSCANFLTSIHFTWTPRKRKQWEGERESNACTNRFKNIFTIHSYKHHSFIHTHVMW